MEVKKDASLSEPIKLNIHEFELLRTLGSGKNAKLFKNRCFWKSEAGKEKEDKRICSCENNKKDANNITGTSWTY